MTCRPEPCFCWIAWRAPACPNVLLVTTRPQRRRCPLNVGLCHTERCMFGLQNKAKNKIILFLFYEVFFFYFWEKEGILQNHTRPPRLPLSYVWIGTGVVGSSPLAKWKGRLVSRVHCGCKTVPTALSISVLGLCQNNVSVQKYFCIFHLNDTLSICIVCIQLETFSMESSVIFIKRLLLFM